MKSLESGTNKTTETKCLKAALNEGRVPEGDGPSAEDDDDAPDADDGDEG